MVVNDVRLSRGVLFLPRTKQKKKKVRGLRRMRCAGRKKYYYVCVVAYFLTVNGGIEFFLFGPGIRDYTCVYSFVVFGCGIYVEEKICRIFRGCIYISGSRNTYYV